MASQQLIDNIALVLTLIMYMLWVKEVFVYFVNKFKYINVDIDINNRFKYKQSTVNKQNQQQTNQQDKDSNNLHTENNGLTFKDNININTPIIELLFCSNNDKKKNFKLLDRKQPNLIIYHQKVLSLVMTAIICIGLFSLIIDQRLLSLIVQKICKSATIVKAQQTQHTLYVNTIADRISLIHLIANLVLLVKVFHYFNNLNQYTSKQQQQLKQQQIQQKPSPSYLFVFFLNLIMIIANPTYISIIVLQFLCDFFNTYNQQHQHQKKQKPQTQLQQTNPTLLKSTSTFKPSSLLILPIILLSFPTIYLFQQLLQQNQQQQQNSITQIYQQTLFPQLFTPQSNLMWIFYAHMFNRYLKMYQLIMFILPICFAVPLSILKITYGTKIVCQYFVIIFTSYYCTDLDIFIFWIMVLLNLQKFSSFNDPLMKKINKSLGLVAFVGSIFFFFVYKKMISLYLSSWMVNIGYPFVFGCVAWALVTICLSQLIKIQLQQISSVPYQSKQTSKLTKTKENFWNYIKNKLWTKTD